MLFGFVALASCAQHHERETSATGGQAAPSAVQPARATRAELLERLRVPLSRSNDGLRWQPHATGGGRLDLQGRARHAAVARVGRDGRVHVGCVDSLTAAERALSDEAKEP